MNYYERHLGDYSKDTAHLTMIEHGAYGLLLDRYYGTEAGIPADLELQRDRTRQRGITVRPVGLPVIGQGEIFKLEVSGLSGFSRSSARLMGWAALYYGEKHGNYRKTARTDTERVRI